MRLCNQRLWVYLQKSFLWREPYQTHCGDTFATDLAFRSRCIPTECHRWRCRLIPCVQGALGDFFTHHCPIADWRHALQCRWWWFTTIREPRNHGQRKGFVRCIGITYLRRDSNPRSLGPLKIGPNALWSPPSGHRFQCKLVAKTSIFRIFCNSIVKEQFSYQNPSFCYILHWSEHFCIFFSLLQM